MSSVAYRAAQSGLLAVIAIFVPVLTAGWHRLLLPSVANQIAPLAWTLALAVAVIAVVLARTVAALILEAREATEPDRTWWGVFFVLFLISALGTMNTAFYYGEGRLVVKENIDKASNCLDQLEQAAKSILATPNYDEKFARVSQLQVQLEAELRNFLNCGQGPVARRIIRELRQELPAFHIPSGSANCQAVEPLIRQYREIIDSQLKLLPEYREDRVSEKQSFASELRVSVTADRKSLAGAKDQLSMGTIDDAKRVVEDVALKTGQYITNINGFGRDMPTADIKCGIDLDAIRWLGTPGQIIPLLLSRLDHVSTYLYILAAVLADIILIKLWGRVLRGSANAGTGSHGRINGPQFLWVNQRQ